ncbi:MAG: hypothetical protein DRI90_11735, partial [Deltaproteobacteria bacterium]
MVDAPRSPERLLPARQRPAGLAALLVLALSSCDGSCAKSTPPARADGPADAFPPPMTRFDDFSSGKLESSRWTPKDSLRGFADRLSAPHATQLSRRVEEGALRIESSLIGETAPGPGAAVAHFRSTLTDPTGVDALEATITVHGVHTASC